MIELEFLGGAGVDRDGLGPNARVRQRYPLALLALIADSAPRPQSRDLVCSLLWPDSGDAKARNSLRQALYHIRQDLGDDVFLPDPAHGLQLDPAKVRSDLWEFRESFENNDLEGAVEIYGGDFLGGFSLPGGTEIANWADSVAQELRLCQIEALDALGRRASDEGRLEDAVQWRRRLAAANPVSSRAALSLLKTLTEAGERAGALEFAAVYEQLIRDRLDVEPDPAVEEFVAALRANPELARRAAVKPAEVVDHGETVEAGEDVESGKDAESAAPPPTLPVTRIDSVPVPVATEHSPRARLSSLAAAAVGLLLLATGAVLGRFVPSPDPADAAGLPAEERVASSTIVLGSAARLASGRDQAVRLLSCEGPACPTGPYPQQAFVVARHASYGPPVVGTGFIAPVPDGTTIAGEGYDCCTLAVFETEFTLPLWVTSARVIVTALADNRARFEVNGVPFGGLGIDTEEDPNYRGPHPPLSTVFLPSEDGRNVLRIIFEDGGGALGLQFHATVTYTGTN